MSIKNMSKNDTIEPFIKVNSGKVYLDGAALSEGELRLADGSLSEQCDGCGEDILETGELSTDAYGSVVACERLNGGCGTYFLVRRD